MAAAAKLYPVEQAHERQDAALQRKGEHESSDGQPSSEVQHRCGCGALVQLRRPDRSEWVAEDVALVSAELQRRAILATLNGEFLEATRLLDRARGLLWGRLQAEAKA